MKPILFSLLAFVTMIACKNKNDKPAATGDSTAITQKEVEMPPAVKSVAGKWKPVAINIANMPEEEKKEMIANIRIEFTEDGKFIGVNKDNKQEGTYTWNEKENLLTVYNSSRDNKPEKFTIGWEDDLLLMTNEEGTVKLKKE
jgi:hypothetical protein